MPLKLIIKWGSNTIDYTNYLVHKSLTISESLNAPAQCTFALQAKDTYFLLPPERAYVDFQSTLNKDPLNANKPRSLFTGFVASRPALSFLGSTVQPITMGQVFNYQISCVADDHLLNIKSVQFIPAFVNRYQGDVLKGIAETLCPGFFNTTRIAKGDLVPYFEYDPKQSWSEIAKMFGDPARYRVKARNKALVYQPYGDAKLGISYDESKSQGTFDPRGLSTDIMNVPTVNDVTIIGAVEAGNNREDYFIGDGFTGNFPLLHKMFRGASAILLQESWNGVALNRQNWFLSDPGGNFNFTTGALNVLGGAPMAPGVSYLQMLNAIEVAGSLDIEHGEVVFNGACDGIIGGIYDSTTFDDPSLIAGFYVTTPGAITPPPLLPGTPTQGIGVGGIRVQALYRGQEAGDSFVTKPNHTYVLQTLITAPKYARYNQAYRALDGTTFGNTTDVVKASITFSVQDYDIVKARQYYYSPDVIKMATLEVDMPAFVVYALINNRQLNLTLTRTVIATMPEGAVFALTGPMGLSQPTGYLPLMPAVSGGFIGPVVPWPGASANAITPGPLPQNDTAVQEVLGNGLELAIAQIAAGNETDILQFYIETMPIAGTPIRLQSFEAQAAVSRIQNAASILEEKDVVGDDGLRSAIISDLKPLPRTSEDCDNAALAFLKDRSTILYDGNYACTSMFFTGLSGDWQFYPTVGRFFEINSPARSINNQKYLVTTLQITVLDLASELLAFNIGFGADLYLEKMLANFVDTSPQSVLTPQDKANPPNPRFTQDVTTSFLPDLNNVQVDMKAITSDYVMVNVFDAWAGEIELRTQDYNWGRTNTADYLGIVLGPRFRLNRTQSDQVWYMRPTAGGKTSRRSKVIRVLYPRRPDRPLYIGATATTEPGGPKNELIESFVVQFGMQGDIRNIWGFELRAADDTTILVQKQATTALSDLLINMAQTAMPWLTPPYNTDFSVYAYFFNELWEYSLPLPIDIRKLATLTMPYIWSPGWVRTPEGDTFTAYSNFGVQPFYKQAEDGTPIISFVIKGQPPVNLVSQIVGEPVITHIYVDHNPSDPNYGMGPGFYTVGISANDGTPPGTYGMSTMSDLRTVQVYGTGSAIHVDIDPPTNSQGMDVFVSAPNDDQRFFWYGDLAPQQLGTAILNVPTDRAGAPDDEFDHFAIQYKIAFHSGILGAQIQPDGVGFSTLVIGGVGADGQVYHFTPNSLVGRTVSMLGKINEDLDIPMANFKIISNDATTITVGPNRFGEAPPDLRTIFDPLDVVAVRMLVSSVTNNGFSDPMFVNPFAPTGLVPDEEKGRLVWIIDGMGRGQVLQIAGNTSTGITLTDAWNPKPDATSTLIIVDAQWQPDYHTQGYKVPNRDIYPGGPIAAPDVQNLGGITWLLRVLTVASDGRANRDNVDIPIREAYAFPALGSSQEDVGIISFGTDSEVDPETGIYRGRRPDFKNIRRINGVWVKSLLR